MTLRKLWGRIVGKLHAAFILPVSRKRHDAIVADVRQQLANNLTKATEQFRAELCERDRQHKAALAKHDALVQKVLSKISRLEFERDEGSAYRIQLTFDPRAFGMSFCPPDELAYLARMVGRQVEEQLATKQFVDSARQYEKRARARSPGYFDLTPEPPR